MKHCVIIRSQDSNDDSVLRLKNKLCNYFKDNIYVVIEKFDDPNLSIEKQGNIILVGRKFLDENGLQYFPRCGWQCGDYILYAVENILKEYDYIWLTEPDLYFTFDVEKFFNRTLEFNDDLLGIHYGSRPISWNWYPTMTEKYDNIKGLYFPFLRISRRAISYCKNKRSEYKNEKHLKKVDFLKDGMINEYANDEVFIATTLGNAKDFKCLSINKFANDFLVDHFSTHLPILVSELNESYLKDKIIHPLIDNPVKIKSKFNEYFRKKHNPIMLSKRMNEIISSNGIEVWNKLTELDPKDIKDAAIEKSNEIFFNEVINLLSKKYNFLSKKDNNFLEINFSKEDLIFKIKLSHGFVALDLFSYNKKIKFILKNYILLSENSRIYKAKFDNNSIAIVEIIVNKLLQIKRINQILYRNQYYFNSNNIVHNNPINLYWWDGVSNFGDWIGPWLISKVLDKNVVNSINTPKQNNVIYSVGSVLQMIDKNHESVSIWGSGIMSENGINNFINNTNNGKNIKKIGAVRGMLTRNVLVSAGFSVPEIYGDPALLMPKFYNPKKVIDRKICIVPHWKHIKIFEKIDNDYIFKVDVRNNLIDVIDQITSCSFCFSTSLHGVIIAQAYNIPWVWIDITDSALHAGEGFKFYDFFSIFQDDLISNKLSIKANEINERLILSNLKIAKLLNYSKNYNDDILVDSLSDVIF